LAITNLECPLTDDGPGIKKVGPLLRAPANTARTLSDWGFKLVTLANNHIMDYKSDGLVSTINACKENGIAHVGAGANNTDAKMVYYTKIGDQRVAVLNFAENEFSTTHGKSPGANPLEAVVNYGDIVKAKELSDFVLVIVHGGNEMYNLPSLRTKNTLRFFAEAGADAVIQHHAHCYSGYELYKGVPIFYGLGNFIFDKPHIFNSPWNTGYAVELTLEPQFTFKIIPYEQSNGNAGVRLLYNAEMENFFQNVNRLNNIIGNDDHLCEEFEKYCTRVKRLYDSFLEPHSIRLFHFLRNRNLLPSFLSRHKKTLYLNLFRCESHREVVINILKRHEHV
jgi:poly-gamma-glutamate synthesis protein (capsule biosynthesis protein)